MSLPAKLRPRLSYANVMSSIAVFVALGGGAYAVSVPRNSVGQVQLQSDSVTAAKVKNRSLSMSDFKRGQLPVLGGVRAADLNPPPKIGKVIKSVSLSMKSSGKAFVLATVRDVFLTCGGAACSGQWGVYVDNRPVRSTGMRLQATSGASDGYGFYTLYGLTSRLSRGSHTVKLGLTSVGGPTSVGQLGAQIGALTLGS